MASIEVRHVTKAFKLGTGRTLRQTLADVAARLRRGRVRATAPFKALDDVSFTVEPGEVVGIIGHNGAGKSTLLKLLARITPPSSGSVRVDGRVAPLIEVGAGLVGDLTGRENIFLNGAILGMKRSEIARKFDEIVAFAELESFVDTPVKRYSSGMQVRLGFAIATSVPANVLIVDEVLAVGDLAFQRKCYDRMQEMIHREGRTILMVSHNMREIERVCKRVLLLDHGRLVEDGQPLDVCNRFFEISNRTIRDNAARLADAQSRWMTSAEAELLGVEVVDQNGAVTSRIPYEAPFGIRIRLRAQQELTDVVFIVGIQSSDFLTIATHTSRGLLRLPVVPPGEHAVQCDFAAMPFLPGVYSVRLEIAQGVPNHGVFYGEGVLHFDVTTGARSLSATTRDGFVEVGGAWRVADAQSGRVRYPGSARVAGAPGRS